MRNKISVLSGSCLCSGLCGSFVGRIRVHSDDCKCVCSDLSNVVMRMCIMPDWVTCSFWHSRCMFSVVEGSSFNILPLNDSV